MSNVRARVRLLQIAVAMCGLVPIGAGLAGVLLGPRFVDDLASTAALDSHFRYLSGLLLAIGVAFWSLIPSIATRGRSFRLLTAIVVAGGLGRLISLLVAGAPTLPMLLAVIMELIVTPLLCLWQWRAAVAVGLRRRG